MLPLLRADPVADLFPTSQGLCLAQAHITMRFDVYARFPDRLLTSTKAYNPARYAYDIQQFLRLRPMLSTPGTPCRCSKMQSSQVKALSPLRSPTC